MNASMTELGGARVVRLYAPVWVMLLIVALAGCGSEGSDERNAPVSASAAQPTSPAAWRAQHLASVQTGAGVGYAFAPGADRAHAVHQRQRWATVLRPEGLRVTPTAPGRDWWVELEWTGLGRVGDVRPPGAAGGPVVAGNRANLRRAGGLEEWYLNGPLGLEQGFVLGRRPAGDGALVVELSVGGALEPMAAADGRTIRLCDERGRTVLRYTDLFVHDAAGRELGARMAAAGGMIRLYIDDRAGAEYPVTIDPLLWVEQTELAPSDPTVDARFGAAVSLHGDTAVVGAPFSSGTASGAAYVFVDGGSGFTEQAKLFVQPKPVAGDRFGRAVAVDGDTAIVGAPRDEAPVGVAGAAYVFVRSATTWSEEQKLVGDVVVLGEFGSAVAIQGDTAAVGAPRNDVGPHNEAGSVFVFQRSAAAWSLQVQLVAEDATPSDHFGHAVALDGDRLLVGAPWALGPTSSSGAAYMFHRSGTAWTQDAKLIDPGGKVNDQFGRAVGSSGDWALVAAPFDAMGGLDVGMALAYHYEGGKWAETQQLSATDADIGDRFGCSLQLSGDTAILCASHEDDGGVDAGAAYPFVRNGVTWEPLPKLVVTDAAPGDIFGGAVALHGTTALVAAPGDDDHASEGGSAYVFVLGWTDAEPCSAATDCLSGYCVDDTCCASACPGACEACNVEGSVGVCTPFVSGSAGEPSCAPYVCDGVSGACLTFCTALDDCAAGYYCDEGTCAAQGSYGAGCQASEACLSGICVDGHCCNSECDGPCEGCDVSGQEGLCAVETAGTVEPDCDPYLCDGQYPACPSTCDDGDDCAAGAYCRDGSCVPLIEDGQVCAESLSCQSGICLHGICCQVESCAPYRCGPTGQCRQGCDSSVHCAPGYTCSSKHTCEAPGDPSESGGCGCGVPGGRAPGGAAWLGLCGLLLCGLRRSLRRHQSPAMLVMLALALLGCGSERTPPGHVTDELAVMLDGEAGVPSCVVDGRFDFLPLDGVRAVASNQAHGFVAELGRDGLWLRSARAHRRWSAALAVTGWGRPGALEPVAALDVPPRTASGRAWSRRGAALTEWYANGPRGLEQGFALGQPPSGPTSGPLVIELTVSGDLASEASGDGAGVRLASVEGRPTLRYTDLVVHDAEARELEAWMEVHGDRIRLVVDDRGATYPVVVDPLVWAELTKLQALDGHANDNFGTSVGLDGATAVMGAPFDADGGPSSGSAYVFVRDALTWTQQAKLMASDAASNDRFGSAAAVAGDTAVVGAPMDVHNGTSSGSAYVFERTGTTWTEQTKLLPSDAIDGEDFGTAVSVDSDTILVGAVGADAGGIPGAGAVYVFVRAATSWSQQAKLTATSAANYDFFGVDVDLEGNTAAVGASNQDSAGVATGSVYVFARTGTAWTEQAQLVATDPEDNEKLGSAVSIAGDTIVAGAPYGSSGPDNQGRARVFWHDGGSWSQQATLTATASIYVSQFGASVGVSGDRAIIGAPASDNQGSHSGAVYEFVRNGSSWQQLQQLAASDGNGGDWLGNDVDLQGATALVAAFYDDDLGIHSGSVYVFTLGLEVGDPCGADSECLSFLCADGVCCDTPCDGPCDACDLPGSEGICSFVPVGEPGEPSCVPYACDGKMAACPDDCSGIADCAVEHYCAADGTCLPQQGLGTPCADDADQCLSGHCTDGLCCDGLCAGPCELCTATHALGTCIPMPEGMYQPVCIQYLCDGLQGECPEVCSADWLCATNHYCEAAACMPRIPAGGQCTEARVCATPYCTDGLCCLAEDCTPFRCGPEGACYDRCESQAHCATGYRCSSEGWCVAESLATEDEGCGCRLVGGRKRRGDRWLALGLVLLVAGRRITRGWVDHREAWG